MSDNKQNKGELAIVCAIDGSPHFYKKEQRSDKPGSVPSGHYGGVTSQKRGCLSFIRTHHH